MKWFFKAILAFMVLTLVLFVFVYFMTPALKAPGVRPEPTETESATSAPSER